MLRRAFLQASLAGAPPLLAACSPFSVVNALVPARASRSSNLSYGPHERHRLVVYSPAEGAGAVPVVVFFYGGNWRKGERGDYRFAGEALASKGFVAVLPDYRLYPEVRYPAFLEDCAKAVQWSMTHIAALGGDPRRTFLMGHSAGAYNAAMLALDTTYLRAAGADPAAIRGLIGLAGPYDFLPLQADLTKAVFGFPDTPVHSQPIHFVSARAPAALLATGADDEVVDPGNSERLAARLREKGVQVRHTVYPGTGHSGLLAALAAPLRGLNPVLADVAGFIGRQAG